MTNKFIISVVAILSVVGCGGANEPSDVPNQCPSGRIIDMYPSDQNPDANPNPGHCVAALDGALAPWCCDPVTSVN